MLKPRAIMRDKKTVGAILAVSHRRAAGVAARRVNCPYKQRRTIHNAVGATGQSPLRFEKEAIGIKELRIFTEADHRHLLLD
jgi:hypothetical protein